MIATYERLVADIAFERFLARMFAHVSRKLVAAHKTFRTIRVLTHVWLVACVNTRVLAQVRRLRIGFLASLEKASKRTFIRGAIFRAILPRRASFVRFPDFWRSWRTSALIRFLRTFGTGNRFRFVHRRVYYAAFHRVLLLREA
jgi:hypothetical protein